MLNTFGVRIPCRTEILASERCSQYAALVLSHLFRELGLPEHQHACLLKAVLALAASEDDDEPYERRIHADLQGLVSAGRFGMALQKRAERIFRQLSTFLAPGLTLDLGCGDARLGKLIQTVTGQTILADVYRNDEAIQSGLPIIQIGHEDPLPFKSNSVGTAVLCTILHHAANPLHTLSEAVRVVTPRGRLLVHESVYGAYATPSIPDFLDDVTAAFVALNESEQFAVNVFFDHYYNRCIHYSPDPASKVPVPYNYLTPLKWCEVFKDAGLAVEHVVHLGVDQPSAPLYHSLFVTRKE